MQRRDINAADAPAPAGQYTQAVEVTAATRTLYISGAICRHNCARRGWGSRTW
jgi:enamine deaminase RidA (YjgF/YER057c/UK114 family)